MADFTQIFSNTSSGKIPFKWFSILNSSFDTVVKVYIILIVVFVILGFFGLYFFCTRMQSINDKYTRFINSERLCRNNLIFFHCIFSLPYKWTDDFHLLSYSDWEHLVLNKKRKKEHKEYEIRRSSKEYYSNNSNVEKGRVISSPPTSNLKNRHRSASNNTHDNSPPDNDNTKYQPISYDPSNSNSSSNENIDNNIYQNMEENSIDISINSSEFSSDITTQVNYDNIDSSKPGIYNSSSKLMKSESDNVFLQSDEDLNKTDIPSNGDSSSNSSSIISIESDISHASVLTDDTHSSDDNSDRYRSNRYSHKTRSVQSRDSSLSNRRTSNPIQRKPGFREYNAPSKPIGRNPTTLEYKSLEEIEKEDNENLNPKTVAFEPSTKSNDVKKHHRRSSLYTPRVYFFFPNLIFNNKFYSFLFYVLDMVVSVLFSLAYLPYVFLGFYIYGIVKMSKTIPNDTRGWVLDYSFELLKGTCSFLFGSCGYLIYQSIKYYKVKAIIKKEKKKRKKTLKLTFYKKLKYKSFKKKEGDGNQFRGDTKNSAASKNSDLIWSHENSGKDTHIYINNHMDHSEYASDISNALKNYKHNSEGTVNSREIPRKSKYNNRRRKKDDNADWKPRLKHIYPQYTYWLKNNASNYLQIVTIIIQVFQLIDFPIEDIYNNPLFQTSINKVYKPIKWFTKVSNYFTSLFIVKRTPETSPFLFITIWWLTVFLAILYIIFYIMNYLIINKYISKSENPKLYRNMKRISGLKWISCLIPIFNISYIAILCSYINTLSCLLNWNSSLTASTDRFERCHYVIMKPGFFISYFIVGFSIAYLVLSAIVISNEPLPEPGMIAFTSRSVIIIKHTNLLIMIMYNILQIVVNEWKKSIIYHVTRCIGAIIVSFLSMLYIAYVGTCYVRIVDAWRVYSQLLVVWACCISLIFAVSPDGSDPFIYNIYKAFGKEQSPAFLFIFGFVVISVIVFLCFRLHFKKHPGGVGEDGKCGHGTKSYTEAFLPRNNNVAISTLKNILLNNIKHHHHHHKKHSSQDKNKHQSLYSDPGYNGSDPQLPATVTPTPRLLYLQDEYKYIADD